MYDGKKILAGLVLFLLLIGFPIWYNAARGTSGARPTLARAVKGRDCVLPRAEMAERHMDLLNTWRVEYVREGKVLVLDDAGEPVQAPDGKPMLKSLSGACLDCHADKTQFCDRCHDYAGVKPYCWDCHVVPRGGK